MPKFYDLTGRHFGRWTVIGLASHGVATGSGKRKPVEWLCRCACGTERRISTSTLNSGKTSSCGCAVGDRSRTHGLSKHPLYDTWSGIRRRVTIENSKAYGRYGGRGLTLEPDWLDSPSSFISDVLLMIGPKPSDAHSIDRVDNDLGYVRGNLRWALACEQNLNKRSNRLVVCDGESRPLAYWCHIYDRKYTTVKRRLNAGWPAEEAIKVPTDGRKHFPSNLQSLPSSTTKILPL